MNAHDEPVILELPNVWHLASDVKAELAEIEGHVPTCLALINALHRAGIHFGERLHYWHGNLLFLTRALDAMPDGE